MNPDSTDRYLDLKGASAYASLGVSTIREHIRKDSLPCFKIGGKILIKLSEFNQWIEHYRLHKDRDIGAIVDSVVKGIKG